MKKRNGCSRSVLFSLYTGFVFQKMTVWILLVSILLMAVGLLLCANPWLDKRDYLTVSADFHRLYFQQALFLIQIFNSVILSALIGNIMLQASGFDILFLPFVPRKRICSIKLLVLLVLFFFLCFFEAVLTVGIAFIRYPEFRADSILLASFGYLLLAGMYEALLASVLTVLWNSAFTPTLTLILFLSFKILDNNMPLLGERLSVVLPYVRMNPQDVWIELLNPVLIAVWIGFYALLYIQLYTIRDIKA